MSSLAVAMIAVSVTVIAPSSRSLHWTALPSATLGSAITQWAAMAGVAAPEIDRRIADYSVGGVSLTAGDLCSAVDKFLSALKYANPQPRLAACDKRSGLRIVAADRDRDALPAQ